MKHLGWALAVIAVALVHAGPAAAGRDEHRAWVKEVPDATVWRSYSKTVGSDQLGKCIIDVKSNDIYFFDVNLFNIHADFVLGVLLKQAWTADHIRESNKNYERDKPRFILCYLTHHLKVDRWTFSFWDGDKIGAADVLRVKRRLAETFFVTPVAGILATAFSTPLSHVNLRAGAWHIPNAGDKKAREKYARLDGTIVYYEVTDTGMTLREGPPPRSPSSSTRSPAPTTSICPGPTSPRAGSRC